MSKCLILLTNYFPYHKGEEYIESEINYLSTKFNKILVIPTMISTKMKMTRTLPDNATVLPINIDLSLLGKAKVFFKQYNNIRKDTEKKEIIKLDSKNKVIHKLYCYYFEARAMEVYNYLKKKLRTYNFEKYSSVSIYSYWFYVTSRVAVELKYDFFRNLNPYTFTRAHGYDINEYVNPLNYLPLRKFLLEKLDNVFPVSQHGVDFLNKKYPGYEHKIHVKRLGTKKIEKVITRNNKPLHIVSCSTIRKLKRIDIIIEALELLQNKNIEFRWTHIGDGPESNKIRQMAGEKLKKENYHFTGHLSNEKVLEWYKQNPATVFINTSSSEGVPVSIMEAMSMSLPVIATDVGGTKEIIEPNKTGFLLRANCTKQEVADSLLEIYSMNQETYNNMCKSAYLLWDKLSNSEKLYKDFVENIIKNSKIYKKKSNIN